MLRKARPYLREANLIGGDKEAVLGREGGCQGIEVYLDTKYVCIGGLGR